MQTVILKHNPYKLVSTITINGEAPRPDSTLVQYLNQRFQLWVDKIPSLLHSESNDRNFDLTFYGTELDYQDLLAAIDTAQKSAPPDKPLTFTTKKMDAKEFGEKEEDIKELFGKIQKLPFDELKTPAVRDAFDKAFNEEFDVNVVATMSAGKSTLINALLGQKLMPSKNGACTATITKIKDDDDDTFKAIAMNSQKCEIAHYSNLDYKTMTALNKNPEVSEIDVEGNIPFVNSSEISLVLIDTPGPDNARDANHGIVTANALAASSKMLVLFVMNGGKLHDEAQDSFLRKIAKSMSVGGKQSRERFLFVINKMDGYDEEDDDIKGETIPDTIEYLKEVGIENPNIFPAAAQPALLIRRYMKTHDEQKKQKLYNELLPIAQKLVAQEQLHLEQYPNLVHSCQSQIDSELQTAIENDDIIGQALIHTGIRGIEETIRMYVTKYCRPAKITNVVDTFVHGLDSARAFERTKLEITSREDEIDKISTVIEKLENKLTSKKDNEAFKRKISSLDISTSLNDKVIALAGEVQSVVTNFFNGSKAEMEEEEAFELVKKFSRLADAQQTQFTVSVNLLLKEDIKDKSQKILTEYINKLNALSDELSTNGLSIDLTSFVNGTLKSLNADNVLDASVDSRTETHRETRTRTVIKERKKWNPMRLFKGDYYDVVQSYTVDVKEEIKFISREKLINALVGPVRVSLNAERARIADYAKSETIRIKEYFYTQFDEVDKILAQKATELREATASKESSERAKASATDLLNTLDQIKDELDAILEI